jgi:hypothetical protein
MNRLVARAAMMLMVGTAGCGGCNVTPEGILSLDFGWVEALWILNGGDCQSADSSWRCTSARGDRMTMALYGIDHRTQSTLSGIAEVELANGTGDPSMTLRVRHFGNRIEIGPYVATNLVEEREDRREEDRLRFELSGNGLDAEAFECERATGPGAVLDTDCDGVIDALATATATPSPSPSQHRTASRTPTSTVTPASVCQGCDSE